MINFEVDEQMNSVNVYAVINAYLDPNDSWLYIELTAKN